jgi:hypothetical protein
LMTLRQNGRRGCARGLAPLSACQRVASKVPGMEVVIQGISLVVAFGILAVLAVRPNDSRR